MVAMLAVGAASGNPPGPALKVACSQQALIDAINTANSDGGGTFNLAALGLPGSNRRLDALASVRSDVRP